MLHVSLIILAPVVIGYFWYAALISRRNTAQEALSGVDVQLQKRSNLIPNILTIAQKHMDIERELITEITRLREEVKAGFDKGDREQIADYLKKSGVLGEQLGQLMIRAEAYPELRSVEAMTQAQRTYNEVEAQIAAARRFYNSAVNRLNTAAQIFPGTLIAGWAGVKTLPSFEAQPTARAPVGAADYLS